MAKTRDHYMQEGRDAFKNGTVAPNGNPESWQQKAFAEGYAEARAANRTFKPSKPIPAPPRDRMPQATRAHIGELRRQLMFTNGMPSARRNRIADKIETLKRRYA